MFASFASSQICMAKLASKHRTSNICLPTSKNVFDLNQKHFCLPSCKMCLPSMKCLKNLVVAKRASKDMLFKLFHVRQALLVSFARPLDPPGWQRYQCQVIPSHGNPQMRWTLFGGYLFKCCSVKFTKYLRRHPSKHILTKKPPVKHSRCFQEP